MVNGGVRATAREGGGHKGKWQGTAERGMRVEELAGEEIEKSWSRAGNDGQVAVRRGTCGKLKAGRDEQVSWW